MSGYGLNSEFDIEEHKKVFINYLEVVILQTGKVVYAIPSHQEYLIKKASEKFGVDRREIVAMCPRNMWLDYLTWLLDITGCVCVWNDHYEGKPNRFQKHKLKQLVKAGLLKCEV